jgi:hypothetical protein
MLPYQPASIFNMTFEIDSFYLLSLYAPKYQILQSSFISYMCYALECYAPDAKRSCLCHYGYIMLFVFLIHDRVP